MNSTCFSLRRSLTLRFGGAYTEPVSGAVQHTPMRTSSWLRPALLLALTLAAVVALLPRTPLAAQGQDASRERTMFVSAVDKDGEPVSGLGPDAFNVREDGVRREVLRVSPATEPIDIALLVDNSAASNEEITFFRNAITKFVTQMAPGGNPIAIVALADRPTILADYTTDAERLTSAVGRLFPMSQSGMTLLDAIVETSRGLARRESPRAAIIPVITDGQEFTNRYYRDVAEALRAARAPLHAVTVGQFLHREEHGIRERSFFLDEGPRVSGGQRVALLSPNAVDQALMRIARELSSQYKIVYSRPQSLIAPEKVEISSARADVRMRGTLARGETGAQR